jgi:hypothetical protein
VPTVDIKCPVGPRKLLMKLQLNGEKPSFAEGNLIELACDDCKKRLRQRRMAVARVLHRYNFLGELIESEIVPFETSPRR